VFWLLFLLVGVVFLLCSFLVHHDAENRSRPYWQPYWQAGIFFRDSFIFIFLFLTMKNNRLKIADGRNDCTTMQPVPIGMD